jgi:hypothetical protein
VSANPTNKIQDGLNKRVWKFEIQGNLLPSQDGYILRFDFSNVEAPLTYSFEEDVVGVYTKQMQTTKCTWSIFLHL